MTAVQTDVVKEQVILTMTQEQWKQLQNLMNFGLQAAAVAGQGMGAVNLVRSMMDAAQTVTTQEPVYGNPDNTDGGGSGD